MNSTKPTKRNRRSGWRVSLLASALLSVVATVTPDDTANAHGTSDQVKVVSPINFPASWNKFDAASPSVHHIVYSNDGVLNDISVDIHAAPGSPIVTPFASRTNTGHTVESKVVLVKAACASGVIADGGYRVTIRARDVVTNTVLGYADIAHVSNPIASGVVLGPWTLVGVTSRWRYSTCYQVSSDAGTHVHLELQNVHRFACMNRIAAGTQVSPTTVIGIVGSHSYGARRAYC